MSDSEDDWEALEDSGAFEAEANAEIERKRKEEEAAAERQRAAEANRRRQEQERKQREFEAAIARHPPAAPAQQTRAPTGAQPRPADVGADTPKGPVIKILKRATGAAATVTTDSGPASDKPKKSLREREAEYAAARARIMAEVDGDVPERPKAPTRTQEVKPILREPRGPDESGGFKQRS
eukprot:m.110387 g.110387  ORF g.110387 m.110387 type:complete len:181 (+) comp12883_c0_seq4:9764-10306(+)